MFGFKKSPTKRDEFNRSTFSFAEYDKEAQDFYYKKRNGIRRRTLRVIACFYYPDMRDTQNLYISSDYMKDRSKSKYWGVVCFYGSPSDRKFRGYLPLTVLDDPVNVRVVKKGERIGLDKKDKAWCNMYVVPAHKLESSLPGRPQPREVDASLAAAYTHDAKLKKTTLHGQPPPLSPRAREKWHKSVQVRSSWKAGDRLDVKSDGMWYPATIIDVNDETDLILIHYDGFDSGFDHWVSRDSLDLAPPGKFSKNTSTPAETSGRASTAQPTSRPSDRYASTNSTLPRSTSDDIGAVDEVEGFRSAPPNQKRRWSTLRTGSQLLEYQKQSNGDEEKKQSPNGKMNGHRTAPDNSAENGTGGSSKADREHIGRLERENDRLKKENAELSRRLRMMLDHQRMVYDVPESHQPTVNEIAGVRDELQDWHDSLANWQARLSELAVKLSMQRDLMTTLSTTLGEDEHIGQRLHFVEHVILEKENAMFLLNARLEHEQAIRSLEEKKTQRGPSKPAPKAPPAEKAEEVKKDSVSTKLQERARNLELTIAKVQAMNDEVATPKPTSPTILAPKSGPDSPPGAPKPIEATALGQMLGLSSGDEDSSDDEEEEAEKRSTSSESDSKDGGDDTLSTGSASSSESDWDEEDRDKLKHDLAVKLSPRKFEEDPPITKSNSVEELHHEPVPESLPSPLRRATTLSAIDQESNKTSRAMSAVEQARAVRMRIKAEREKKAQLASVSENRPHEEARQKGESEKQRAVMLSAFQGASRVPVAESPRGSDSDAAKHRTSDSYDSQQPGKYPPSIVFPHSRNSSAVPGDPRLRHHREPSTDFDSGYDMFDVSSNSGQEMISARSSTPGAAPTRKEAKARAEEKLGAFADEDDEEYEEFDVGPTDGERSEAGSHKRAPSTSTQGSDGLSKFKDTDNDDDMDMFDVGTDGGDSSSKREDRATPSHRRAASLESAKSGKSSDSRGLSKFKDDDDDDMDMFDVGTTDNEDPSTPRATVVAATATAAASAAASASGSKKKEAKEEDDLSKFKDDDDDDMDMFDEDSEAEADGVSKEPTPSHQRSTSKTSTKSNDSLSRFKDDDDDDDLDMFDVGSSGDEEEPAEAKTPRKEEVEKKDEEKEAPKPRGSGMLTISPEQMEALMAQNRGSILSLNDERRESMMSGSQLASRRESAMTVGSDTTDRRESLQSATSTGTFSRFRESSADEDGYDDMFGDSPHSPQHETIVEENATTNALDNLTDAEKVDADDDDDLDAFREATDDDDYGAFDVGPSPDNQPDAPISSAVGGNVGLDQFKDSDDDFDDFDDM